LFNARSTAKWVTDETVNHDPASCSVSSSAALSRIEGKDTMELKERQHKCQQVQAAQAARSTRCPQPDMKRCGAHGAAQQA